MLDASKVFDRVEYVRLLTLLRERALCPVVLRLIMNIYVNQCIQIKWNSMISETYCITNGVKQGGVLFPKEAIATFYKTKRYTQKITLEMNNKIIEYTDKCVYCSDTLTTKAKHKR